MPADFIYDEIPYPSYTFAQTNPDRLATGATIYGMKPAQVENCRVLELGCGDGSNLLSFASVLPDSSFVGVDLSARHIADAEQAAVELELQNVRFERRDILEIERDDYGQFDFIIAHGLYSWVPDFVREKILRIYRELLQPEGVGYISYNAYPGCRIREMFADMMRFHVSNIGDPMQKVREGLGLVNFLKETAESKSVYQALFNSEFKVMLERRPENVFHDDLAEINQPFYFHEFASDIGRHDLQYLDEAEFFSMQTLVFSPQVRQTVEALSGGDLIRREQYLDFIKWRRFRQTLVCHREITLEREFKPENLNKFLLASSSRPESETPELATRKIESFVGAKGGSVQIDHPLTKAVLVCLARHKQQAVWFNDLLMEAKSVLEAENFRFENFSQDAETTAAILSQIAVTGLIKLHVHRAPFVAKLSERPQASRFARRQAARGMQVVTTLTGLNLELSDAFISTVLQLLDGTRDRDALLAELKARVEAGELEAEGADKQDVIEALPNLLDHHLSQIAEAGLLIS